MGLFKHIIQSVNNYYNPPQDLSSDIKPYEWFGFNSGASDCINSEQDYRSFAYSCINVRAEKVLTATLSLAVNQANGKPRQVRTHPFLDLMANPNIFPQSFNEIMFQVCISLDLFRQGAFIYAPKDNLKRPVGLYFLPSQCVSFELNDTATQIKRYIYTNGGEAKFYEADEIIHFKLPNPYRNGFFWSSPTAAACKYTLDSDFFQSVYGKNFYLNDAAIGKVFTVPGVLKDEQYNRLDNRLKERTTNPQNAGKHLIAENGMTVSDLTATPKEADYSKTRVSTKDEICGIFRVPKSVLGFVDDVNRANAETSNQSFLRNTIMPFANLHIWNRIEQWIKVNYDERLLLNAAYHLQEPYEIIISEWQAGVNKWIRPNEIRAEKGLAEDWDNEKDSVQTNNSNNNNGTQPQDQSNN